MNCPNCNAKIYNNETLCSSCGINIELCKKNMNISARFYNTGLEMAQNSNFYYAIEALKKSIAFDKHNINSRNLLGLCYYETGRLAEAVKEWIISSNIERSENLASEYIECFKNNMREFEKLNDSVKMYNHAIKYLKQKNDDVAVIRLKKAIDINPKFVDALNLLTLCYIMQKENNKASSIAQKTLEVDVNNPLALKYLRYVNEGRTINEKKANKVSKRPTSLSYEPKRPIVISSKPSVAREILLFAAGVICMGVVMFVLVMPASLDAKDEKISSLTLSLTSVQNEYTNYKAENDEKLSKLEKENQDAKIQLDKYAKEEEINNKISKIAEAETLYNQKKYVEAANLLINQDLTGLEQAYIDKYKELNENAMTKAAQSLYNEGKANADKKKYEEAIKSLNQCLIYSNNLDEIKYNAMYQLGKIAMAQDDKENAKKYFEDVSNNHPSTSIKKYASSYLKGL